MTTDGLLLLIVLVIGICLGLRLLIYALIFLLDGATRLFLYAAEEQGFVGVAAYIALWVIALPVMIVVCILIGFFRKIAGFGFWGDPNFRR